MGKASFMLRWLLMFLVLLLITLRSFHLSTSQLAVFFSESSEDATVTTYPTTISVLSNATTTTTTPRHSPTLAQLPVESSVVVELNEDTEEFHPHFQPNVTWETLLKYPSPRKDKTVPWRRNVPRFWWDLDQKKTWNTTIPRRRRRPPAMLLLTKYGWNQRNQWHGRAFLRSKRQRELLIGLLEHDWFHPTMWDDVVHTKQRTVDPSLRYYIFLDLETCADKNYPNYLQRIANQDKLGPRGMKGGTDHVKAIQDVLQSPFFTTTNNSNNTTATNSFLVLWDCNTYSGKYREKQFWRRRYNQDRRIILAALTAHVEDIIVNHDVGLPPPAGNPCQLTPTERQAIMDQSCDGGEIVRDGTNNHTIHGLQQAHQEQRPYLITFTGNFRSRTRQALQQLHNGHDILIASPTEIMHYMNETGNITVSFQTMAKRSLFSAVPRGDNLFSYRFTEVMSCASIPVVYADGWVFPFHPDLADPREYAVMIPEDDVNRTRDILSQISSGMRCRMRKRGMQLYQQYLKGGTENVRGLIDTLELMRTQHHDTRPKPTIVTT